MEADILVERDGAIATVVLNRPDKLNALTRPMWKRLGDAFIELDGDQSVRCVIIRGAGTRAFAPGNDICEFETERSNVAQARDYGNDMRRTITAIDLCRHPVVAQIHGICATTGGRQRDRRGHLLTPLPRSCPCPSSALRRKVQLHASWLLRCLRT